MARSYCLVSMVLLIFAIAACSPATPATQGVAPTQQVLPDESYYPLTTTTGVESIDQILSALAADDVQSLRSLVEFTNAKCTKLEGLGGPPKCREGEPEGTPVDVLAFLGSEGGHLRKEEIGNWSGIDTSGVYAVYEVSPAVSSEEYYPVGKYAVLLVNEDDRSGTALRIGERGIVRVDSLFDISSETLDAMIQREASAVLLPPKS